MRLKTIEPGMVIHCKTQEEANELCDAVGASKQWKEYWVCYTDGTCYEIGHKTISYGPSYSYRDRKITEFSDLILPELTAEEAIKLHAEVCKGSCMECPLYEVEGYENCNDFCSKNPEKAVEILAKWKADNEKKEPEVEWVYRVFGAENFAVKFFRTEEEAIKRCEELVKSQKNRKYARYERVCRVKEV